MVDRDRVPDLLTIEEAARVLRIGRTAAYEQARVWRETGGRAGIPNIAVGGQLRVPRAALQELIGHPITAIPEGRPRRRTTRTAVVVSGPGGAEVRQLEARRSQRRSVPDGAQGALPL